MSRYISIWFPYLVANRFANRYEELIKTPFVLAIPQHGRMVVTASSPIAEAAGISAGMVAADAKAVLPSLKVLEDKPELPGKLLTALAEWCIRYSPKVAVDMPDGLILEITGCAHLWGGERLYLLDIVTKLREKGYHTRAAIADTIGAAWAVARFGVDSPIVPPGEQQEALLALPPAALRLEPVVLERLEKLGLRRIHNFIHLPRPALRKRFGQQLLTRLDQALGLEAEYTDLICPIEPYQECLPCLEPIKTAKGIEIAVRKLLETLCFRMEQEAKGLRSCILKGYRLDGQIQEVAIGTNKPTRNAAHLYKLFELKLTAIEPDLGIELFLLEAPIVEDLPIVTDRLWNSMSGNNTAKVMELLDKISAKIGPGCIHSYLPQEHHWPELSFKETTSLTEKPETTWRTDLPRPIHLLPEPLQIQVTVPLPDYPPLLFHYNGEVHKIKKADGPERIEQEWWAQDGLHRDYYCVEDEKGCRYWIFRSGHYDNEEHQWFLHGFFA